MATSKTDTATSATDGLGVLHLKEFYERCLAGKRGKPVEKNERDWVLDNIVLCGLGLPIETTMRYLIEREPSYSDFEDWVVSINDGHIDLTQIERINCVVSGRPYGPEIVERLREVDLCEDVLTQEDLDFWDENGYVVARQVISPDQARAAEDAVWDYLGMSRDDPASWYSKPVGKGIMMEFYHHPLLAENRRSLRMRKAYAQLWKNNDLWATVDRTSFNPPETRNYIHQGPKLHWDMSLAPPYYFGTQGVLYLCDTDADQGAFQCVPGLHNKLEDWLATVPEGTDPRDLDLNALAVRVAGRAGDLVIWHQALPHGSSPNLGTYPRLVHYINMYPSDRKDNLNWV